MSACCFSTILQDLQNELFYALFDVALSIRSKSDGQSASFEGCDSTGCDHCRALEARGNGVLHRYRARKKDVVFQMNMLVHVRFKLFERRVKRSITKAGSIRWFIV